MIKTFKGHIANDGQHRIRLSTKKGKVGYRIHLFQIMGPDGNTDIEHVLKIFKVKQITVTTGIDFSDGNLLAAAVINDSADRHYMPQAIVIFDKEVFNQDVYITSKGHDNPTDINYYIELEVMPLTDNAAAVSTLRDIRLNPQVGA